jgi:hypothetical protein
MLKKNKIIATAVALCSVGAIAGVGYSSWIITGGASATVDGTVTVYGVDDHRLGLTAEVASGDNSTIIFGYPSSGTTTGNEWLLYGSDVGQENLSFTLNIEVENLAYLNQVTVVATQSGDGTGYQTANTANYVGALPSYTVSKGEFTSGSDGTGTYSREVVFSWGTYFNSENPYTYYNSKTATEERTSGVTYADDAKTSLGALYSDLNGVSYTLTVTATATEN